MLKTVRDACELYPTTIEYSMKDQVENLYDATKANREEAELFFRRNEVTQGLNTLLTQGLQRLGGRTDQAVFELTQAMGGGKTHSMIAFGLLARFPELRAKVLPESSASSNFGEAKVVAISGRETFDNTFIWGEIGVQLGKGAEFSKFWREGPKPPGESDWIELLGDEPVLILLDELPPYFDYAVTRPVGAGTLANTTRFALANLLSAALKLKRCCVVLSNLSGTYEGASRELRQAIRDFEQEAKRQARSITPVELASMEVYAILRKRLFAKMPDESVVDSVAAAYAGAISEAVKSKSIAKSAESIAEEIRGTYPFHPSVKHVVAMFKENTSFRQTRGLMQFISRLLKSVWNRKDNDVYLIGCQHLDLNLPDVREEVNAIGKLQGAIAHDIASGGTAVAEVVDQNLRSDAASQCAALLLTASLSESLDAVKGFTKQQMLECVIAPNRTAIEFQDAFDTLKNEAWYLHRKDNDTFYFSNIENLKKRIDNRAEKAPVPKIEQEMRRRLEEIFQPEVTTAYQRVYALPVISEIQLSGPRVCLVLSPDSKVPPKEAQEFWENVTEKNNFCVVTGGESNLGSLEEKTRRIWAIERVQKEIEENSAEKLIHQAELEEEAERAILDFNTTVVSMFNRVYYPGRGPDGGQGLIPAKLSMTFAGNQFRADEQVEKALADTGAMKFYRKPEEKLDMLFLRAEDLLWPAGGERRALWRDVVSKALSNPRWPWLPSKSLEMLRSRAEGSGRWRDVGDGYLEKGPFPKPRTRVILHNRTYNAETGRATIEVLAKDAGRNGQVHFATEASVSSASPLVQDFVFETDEIVLWFLAVDPDGEYETGEPTKWENELTITHQPTRMPDGRTRVELTVKPPAEIRWNTNGANPKTGTVYTGPIELPGDTDTVLYTYAECRGVSKTREFRIHKADKKGPATDKTKPARLIKTLQFRGTSETFVALSHLDSVHAILGSGLTLDVGEGATTITTRASSSITMVPADIHRFIDAAREILKNPTATVVLRVESVGFQNGHDLETFLQSHKIEAAPGDVEQEG